MSAPHINLSWFDTSKLRNGASEPAILDIEQAVGFRFPESYVSFLRATDGYEGFVGEGYTSFWTSSELIGANKDYGFESFVPGYFAIGSDGGGESFGFNSHSRRFFMVPFISAGWKDATEVGEDFIELLARIQNSKLFERAGKE